MNESEPKTLQEQTKVIARNYYTQVMSKFFAGIRSDAAKCEEFIRSAREIIEEAGKAPVPQEFGRVMAAGIISSINPEMQNVPDVIQKIVAHVLIREVDWDYLGEQMVSNHEAN